MSVGQELSAVCGLELNLHTALYKRAKITHDKLDI